MNLGIDNRFAIVCASTKGLGFAIVQSLLAEGVKVVICSSKKENLDSASELLDNQGYKKKYFPFLADLSTSKGVTNLFEFSLSHSETIDILVNNCGGPDPGNVNDIKEHQLDDAINKNLRKFLYYKNSIAINGVSLTIAKVLKYGFQISIVPQTLKLTNLFYLKEKDLINVEFDILGKYIKNIIK